MQQVDHEVVMIGAGPSALTAALYTAREEIDTVLYEKSIPGGLVATTDWIDNYPGFKEGVDGIELAEEFQAQAERFGAKIEYNEVESIRRDGDVVRLQDASGREIAARAVLIATGSNHKKLGIPGEDEYHSRGVHYCATCDGAFYKDQRIAVIGGGNSAVQEALFLTRYASHIDLIVRSELRASEVLLRKLEAVKDSITVHTNVTTDEIIAHDNILTGVRVTDRADGESRVIEVGGVFVFIGLEPNTKFLKESAIELDGEGFVVAKNGHETSMPGVFVSGDVRSGAVRQIASAVGEGAVVAGMIREYLELHKGEVTA